MARLAEGERVLDLGSGVGTDSLIAAQMVGERGQVTGIDMTQAMLAKARAAAEEMGLGDTRRKAQKYGARGTTLKAYKPQT